VEETGRKAERAWSIPEEGMRAKPPRPSEVSSLGKLRVFLNLQLGTFSATFVTVLEMLIGLKQGDDFFEPALIIGSENVPRFAVHIQNSP